jgi:hypothetical protein
VWEQSRKKVCGQNVDKSQALDLERVRTRALLKRLNVPPDLVDEDFDCVEKTDDGESREGFRDSSLRLCDGTGK